MRRRIITSVALFLSLAAVGADVKRAPKEFSTISEMANQVPGELMPRPGENKWTDVQLEASNAKLKELVIGQKATLTMKVTNIVKRSDSRLIYGEHIKVNKRETYQHALFTEDKAPLLAKLKIGETIIVKGTVYKCWFHKDKGAVILDVMLSDCTLPNK